MIETVFKTKYLTSILSNEKTSNFFENFFQAANAHLPDHFLLLSVLKNLTCLLRYSGSLDTTFCVACVLYF